MKNYKIYVWIACLFLFLSIPVVQAEEQIIIDGNFSDWEGLDISYTDINTDAIKKIGAISDGEMVYLHLIGSSSWSSLGGETMMFTDGNGATKALHITSENGDQFQLTLKDQNSVPYDRAVITGARTSGSLYQNVRTWEFQIPKNWCGEATSVTFKQTSIPINAMKEPSESETPVEPSVPDGSEAPDESGKPDDNEQPDESEGEGNQGGNVGSGIIIDGYYDDWQSLDHTSIKWQNKVISNACAIRQTEQICVHVGTTYYDENRHLNLDNIRIHINNQPVDGTQIKLREVDKHGNVSTEPLQVNDHNKRYQLVAVINRDGVNYILGDAYYTTKQSQDREDFEFCTNLSELEKALNIKLDTKDQIQFTFPSIGTGSITIEGTSSGPWLIVGLCGLIALGGIYMTKKKEQ